METSKGLTTGQALKEIYTIYEKFNELTKWNEEDYDKFKELLHILKASRGDAPKGNLKFDTTKSKGDALEDVVNFLIRKTFFFTVTENVRTKTNEVDQVIRLSKNGRIAMEYFNITKSLLNIEDEIFLGECKNYEASLSVTYIGKFYSLLKQCNCNFGILFTYNGVSGEESKWADGHGLMKVLKLIEKYTANRDFNIIEFKLEDYENILAGESFFDLVEAKKTSLKVAANHELFLKENISEELHSLISHCKTPYA